MRIVIDTGGVVSEAYALKMIAQIPNMVGGVAMFTGGYKVEVKVTKTQKTFKIMTA